MPQGSAPGERRGGRQKGTPSRRTLERQLFEKALKESLRKGRVSQGEQREVLNREAEKAAKIIQEANERRKPLAKEVLEQLMLVFNNKTVERFNAKDDDGVKDWGKLAYETAKALAPYQSPTFRAITVVPPAPEQQGERVKRFTLTIFERGRGGELIEERALPAQDIIEAGDDEDEA